MTVPQANADDAAYLQRFFNTSSGQYGARDVFIGVRACRKPAGSPVPTGNCR